MKQFLAICLATPNGNAAREWEGLNEAARKERMDTGFKAWGAWAEKYKASIVELGGPLGKTKKTDPKGMSDIKNAMTAYTVVKAETHDEAAKMFLKHPHFMFFPGESIEIMEILPIPTK